MDNNVRDALVDELGEDGYELVERMLSVLGSGSRNDVRAELRRMVEEAADAEGVQTE